MPTPKINKNKLFEKVLRHQTKDKLEGFRGYTLEIESKFQADKSALEQSVIQATSGLSDVEARELEEYFADDYYLIEEVHADLYRHSTLVSVYSFLEHSMSTLCRHLRKRNGYAIELSDLRGEGIVRAKYYLEKLVGVDFSQLNGYWSQLVSFNRVRNCIVHSEGNIQNSTSPEKLSNIVNDSSGLSLRNGRNIKVEREYIESTISTVESFLDELYDRAL